MFIRLLVSLVAAVLSAGALTIDARADYETTSLYWSGYATSGEYHITSYDNACSPISGSGAEFTGPGYVTVALIDSSGGWRYSQISSVRPVGVFINSDTFASAGSWRKKAFCKQSTPWQVSFWMYCGDFYWVQDPVHVFCV
jgi:hypothetical protein